MDGLRREDKKKNRKKLKWNVTGCSTKATRSRHFFWKFTYLSLEDYNLKRMFSNQLILLKIIIPKFRR